MVEREGREIPNLEVAGLNLTHSKRFTNSRLFSAFSFLEHCFVVLLLVLAMCSFASVSSLRSIFNVIVDQITAFNV